MTLKFGVLEWVPNTVPLRQLICDEMSKDALFKSANAAAFSRANDVCFPKLRGSAEMRAWIPWKESKDIHSSYHLNYIKKGISEACLTWESVQRKIPQDYLRRRFASMSHSTESFFAYRKEFMKSFSVSSIYGYVCGIGDRHLNNVLIDTKTGSVVQIDFDISFGKGSILLGVPELIPFRLTPQILAVLEPLEGSIHLRPYMVDVLSALRRNVSVQKLANALDIYLNDPISDWVKTSKEREDTGKKNKEDWEPKRRIENTLRSNMYCY
jgi:DNA-dependent protein kinase catalytic subunit